MNASSEPVVLDERAVCNACRQTTGGDCGQHGSKFVVVNVGPEPPSGWRCPCCRSVYAPSVTECWRCAPSYDPTHALQAAHVCPNRMIISALGVTR